MPPTTRLPPKGAASSSSSSPPPAPRRASMSTSSPARGGAATKKNTKASSPHSSPSPASTKRTASGKPISDRLYEREKQNLLKLSSEQLMRNALKMHFEILDLRQGAALLSDQASVLNDQMSHIDAASFYAPSMIPESTIDPASARRLRSLAAGTDANNGTNVDGGMTTADGEDEVSPHSSSKMVARMKKALTGNVDDAIKQLSSLQRAIEGGLSVIGPVSPRRIPALEPDPSLILPDDAPAERRLDGHVVQLSQAVHHLLAQAFVLAESVSEAQVANQASPSRAAEYLALRAAVAAGEKEIETENSKSSRLQKQLDAMDETVRHLRAARGDLEDTCNVSIHQLQAQKEKLQEQNAYLELRCKRAELERDRANETIERWRRDYDELQEQLEDTEKAKAKLSSENEMNKLLADQSKSDLEELLGSMNSSSDATVAAVSQLRQQLEAANAKNARYEAQMQQLNSQGPLCTEAMLVQQIELQDCEVVEMEERLDIEHDWLARFMEMRLRFQKNQMQRSLNDAITKAATLQNQLNEFESDQAQQGEKAQQNAKKLHQKLVQAITKETVSEREELRRQEIILSQDGEMIITLRDLTFSALRDLDASYVTIANQNDKMEEMQTRIEQLEYDKHDTKELRGMLDTAQKAFNTADSEAGKLLQYLGQAKEEIARLTEENDRVVTESNEKLQEMEDRMNKAVEDEESARKHSEEMEQTMEDLEKKLSSMIEGLEEKLKNAFTEKENLEKQLERVREEDAEIIEQYKNQLQQANDNSNNLLQELESYSRQSLEEVFDTHFVAPQQESEKEAANKIQMITELENERNKLQEELQNRGAASQEEFDKLNQEKSTLEERNKALLEELENTQQELDSTKNQISKSQEELEKSYRQQGEVSDEVKQLQDDLEKARREIEEKDDEIDKLQKELESRAAASGEEFEKLQNEKNQLEQEVADLKKKIESLEEEHEAALSSLKKEIEDKNLDSETEVARLQKELEEKKQEHESALSALKKELDDKNLDSESAVARLQKELEEKNQEHESALASLKKELDEKDQELEDKDAHIERQTKQIESLKVQLEENDEEIKKQRKQLSETGDQAQHRIAELEKENGDLEHKVKQLESSLEAKKQELADAEEKIEKQSEELEKLNEERDSLQRQLAEARENASSTGSEAQKKIADLQQEVDDLKKKLEDQKQEFDTREQLLLDEQTKLQKSLHDQKQRVAELEDNVSSSESDSKRKVSDLECRNVELQTDLDNVTQERDKLRNVSADLSRELDDHKQQVADLQAKNDKLTAQLAKVTASRDRLKLALKDAVQLQDQLSKIAEIQDSNQKLAFDNARLSEQLDQLRSASADAEKQVMLSKTEYAKLEQAIQGAVAAEDDLMRVMDGDSSSSSTNNTQQGQEDSGNSRSTSTSNTPHHEAINRIAASMNNASSTIKRHSKNGEATCSSIQGLMKLIDSLHHQLSLPQPMLMAPTPANTTRGVDSVNDVFPKLLGRIRELIFKASQADANNTGGAPIGIDPVEKLELEEDAERSRLLADETYAFNEFLEDIIGDIEERAIAEGSKVRRAMELLEEAQFAMRGRVGSEKLLGALDMLKQTPGARRGAGLAALQGRAKRGGTVILNINEVDPKYRSIAWLVSTRGSLIDHLGDVFRLIFSHPFQLDKTQRSFGTLLGTFLTQIEKMHIGLPPYLLNMEVVKVREATDKELARILLHSSSAVSHPSAADSPDCSPVRVLHDGVDRSTISNSPTRAIANRDASVGTDHADVNDDSFNSGSFQRQKTPPAAARTVVNNWKSPPPPAAWNTFY